jgi:hypothetical protein
MHIVAETDTTIIKGKIREELKEYGIGHVTLELESKDEVWQEEHCHDEYEATASHHYHHH